jgi:hypothetical protein
MPQPDRSGGGCDGCNFCLNCNCPTPATNVQINQRLVGGYYRHNGTGMNVQLLAIQRAAGLCEASMLRINQYLGFMPLRSTHDSPFFRELVDCRSQTQEALANWLRQNG